MLFLLSDKISDALKYCGPYQFALRIGTNAVQIALAIHRWSKMDWTKTTLQDGFESYDFKNADVFYLEEEAVPAVKRARSASVTPLSVNLSAILIVYRSGVTRATLESVRRDYDEYHGVYSGLNETSREAGADGGSLAELLEQDLL